MNIYPSLYKIPVINSYNNSRNITFKANNSQKSGNIISEKEFINRLLQNENVEKRDENGNTILHELVKLRYFTAIKYLLTNPQRTQKLVNIKNSKGETALDLSQDDKITKFLLTKNAKSGKELVNEEAKNSSARVQVSNPDLMNVFKRKPQHPVPLPEPTQAENSKVVPDIPEAPKTSEQACTDQTVTKAENYMDVSNPQTKKANNIPETSSEIVMELPQELKNYTPLKLLPGDPRSFEDVIGLDEIKDELTQNIVLPLTQEEAEEMLSSNKINIPNGILLVSPAGNGKTHLIKALAAETKMPVVELTDTQNLGELSEQIEKYYNKEHKPVILFIRGMENFVSNDNYSARNCNIFTRNLTQASKRGILVVGTSTDKSAINKNIIIPGLIDKVFKINPPDFDMREKLITKYFDGKSIFAELSHPEFVKVIAEHTAGFSVAQLQHVINETARQAVSSGNKKVQLPEILAEIREYSKEQDIPEINEFNKTSMYDSVIKREQYKADDPQSLDDIGGMNDVKEKVTKKIIEPWQHKDEMEKYGIGMPDGVLLYGPPGSGKTYIVKGIARELKLPLYILNLSDVASSYRHQTTKNIKEIVEQLTEKYKLTGEASVLFLDELDSLGKSKDGGSSADTDEVNTLLQEFNNAGDKGIILVAATNKLDNIEAALARDGRLGERIFVGYGDYDARYDMIHKILASKSVTEELAKDTKLIEKLAHDFDDMPASSIAKVLKEATYQMAINGQDFEKSVQVAFDNYKEKELDDHLTKKGVKDRGRYLQLSKNSTIKYDTTFDRTFLKDNEPHNFEELAGMGEVKAQLKKHIIDMWKPEVIQMFKENGLALPGGVILTGPSGNGKTTIARALAGEMNLPLYELTYDDVADSHIHATSKKMHELFNQLAYKYKKTGERSILFLDEADKFLPERSRLPQNADYKKEEVSELITMMNEASANGIILIGATNHIEMVDKAARTNTRRFGVNIYVGLPDEESRRSIIERMLVNKPIAEKFYNDPSAVEELVARTEGNTIGNLTDALKKAFIGALVNQSELSVESICELLPNQQQRN